MIPFSSETEIREEWNPLAAQTYPNVANHVRMSPLTFVIDPPMPHEL